MSTLLEDGEALPHPPCLYSMLIREAAKKLFFSGPALKKIPPKYVDTKLWGGGGPIKNTIFFYCGFPNYRI